jgi:hypothetical protein
MKRKSFATLSTAVVLSGTLFIATTPAQGQEPVAKCPTQAGYFLQDASAFPLTQAVDDAGNQDGWVCVKILPTDDHAIPSFNIIDDRVAS